MSAPRQQFQWPDYLVFAFMLVGSLGIGVFYAFAGGKQRTTSEFLMGNRGMSIVPVAVSILVSFMSAILILGTPAEIYQRGTMYYIYVIGMCLAILFATLLFVPLLFPLKLTSSYEYLQHRFRSRAAKLTGTLILFVMQILYMGIVLFSPSTALEAVTGFPTWATIVIGGVVATAYTFLGGMKAVIWTDVFQAVIMAAGLLAVVIKGNIDNGGISRTWEVARRGGRIQFFDFNPDPTQRHSFWSLVVGGTVGWMSTYGVNQASVQRYCSLPNITKSRISVLLNIPGVIFLMTITCLCGLVMYSHYALKGCDPLSSGLVRNPNQLMPFYVMEVLNVPGLPGLFLACLFSGSLSTMSSSLNALAAVTWEDLLKGWLGHLSEFRKALVTKMLVVVFGAVGIGFAFMAQQLGGHVLQASLSFTGAAAGPLLGLFLLGGIFPFAGWIGAVIGGILGLALPMWISFGAYTSQIHHPVLNFTTTNCTHNFTLSNATRRTVHDMRGIERLYTVSYLWYPSIGTATVVVLGLLISCITGLRDPRKVEGKYHLPIVERLCCFLPKSTREVARCGVAQPYEEIQPYAESGKFLKEDDLDEIVNAKVQNGPEVSSDGKLVYRVTNFDALPPPAYRDNKSYDLSTHM